MTVTTLPTRSRGRQVQDAPPGRWRPTRTGILNVWRYYDETFEFHRGRLLLRGPNGTGKSKALEVLLPYLLDASLRPSRLSTFGGSERTMHWNLMAGHDGTTRVGYVWIEFSRSGQDGRPQWFTCGARLSATANTRTGRGGRHARGPRADLRPPGPASGRRRADIGHDPHGRHHQARPRAPRRPRRGRPAARRARG